MTEEQDLLNNGILPSTVSRWIYSQYRLNGMDHKTAVKKTVDNILAMKSESMDENILTVLKDAFFNIQGNWT